MKPQTPVIKNFLFETSDADIAGLDPVYLEKYLSAADNLRFELRLVTPGWATRVLETANDHNRRITLWHKRLAAVMDRGNWEVNGEPIGFDTDNRLTNDQHRLSAVVVYGKPVPFVVIYGLTPASFKVTDRVRPRRNSDALHIMGKEHTNALSACLGWLVLYDAGKMDTPGDRHVPYDMLEDVMDQYEGADGSVAFAIANFNHRLPSGLAAFLHYRMAARDPAAAKAFFDRILNATGLVSGSHEWLLVRRLDDLRGRRSARDQMMLAALTIKTWNRIRQGIAPRVAVVWKATEEPFPLIL